MLIDEVISLNYKSCNVCDLSVKNERPNILIGENDCGKTSMLFSMRFLLDSSSTINFPNSKSEKNDVSHTVKDTAFINSFLNSKGIPNLFDVGDEGSYVVFAGKFIVEDFDIDNERDISPHLKWVIESSRRRGGYFWKVRVFNSNTGESNVYYASDFPVDSELDNIFGMTQNQINAAMSRFNSGNENLINDNGEGSYSIYEKARSIVSTVESSYRCVCFKDDSNRKKWKSDLKVFPEYSYLSWNESLELITKIASTILDESIDAEINRAEKFSRLLKSRAQSKIDAQLQSLGIQNEVSSITSISAGVSFELQKKLTDLFVQKVNSQSEVHIENQGEGIKRQIWFGLLKLQAQLSVNNHSNKRYIWCFDEPETHLHPKAQREFFETIKTLASENFQVLISTHSTIFVDSSKVDEINTFKLLSSYTQIGRASNVQSIYDVLGLKNSDFLFFNKFLIVEGNTEETLIPELYRMYKMRTLKEDNIQLINLKGCTNANLAEEMLNQLISGFSKTDDLAIYLFDSDTKRAPTEKVHIVGKQDLEDEIPVDVWLSIIEDVYQDSIQVTENDILAIIDAIPDVMDGQDCPENQKMASKLRSLIYNKLSDVGQAEKINDWPNKSHDWGKKISEYMTIERIPAPILRAFDSLHI
ncbi:AAA family ATPase [Serratia marcescens]|uniref:AAA family ATPase n=1 Tax=Serratia marcescens TaxID=615 RepID=UPI002764983D|nr:AAA family ATPase [Serratia marcescens]MDP8745471.1 AAA family ATPase [Serratia marcescens]